MNVWIAATRPKTLAASAMPVLLASAFAWKEHRFALWVMLITLCCALLLQILANFTNELGDYKRGADTPDRLGPERAVSTGKIEAQTMKKVSFAVGAISFGLGMMLVWYSGWITFAIGVCSLFFAWAYTGGPYPLAYKGLGDVFALLFFGIVPVCGAFYVQTSMMNAEIFLASLAPGLFAANILGVNNIRDIHTDARVGKRTFAVRAGTEKARALFTLVLLAAYSIPLFLLSLNGNVWSLLPCLSLPLAFLLIQRVYRAQGQEYNALLAATGALLVVYTLLLCVGVLIKAQPSPQSISALAHTLTNALLKEILPS